MMDFSVLYKGQAVEPLAQWDSLPVIPRLPLPSFALRSTFFCLYYYHSAPQLSEFLCPSHFSPLAPLISQEPPLMSPAFWSLFFSLLMQNSFVSSSLDHAFVPIPQIEAINL